MPALSVIRCNRLSKNGGERPSKRSGRGMSRGRSSHKRKWPPLLAAIAQSGHRVEEISVLGRPGSDLLFQALRLSTIGAGEFNGRVRDGIGYRLPANTTRPAKDENIQQSRRQTARKRGDAGNVGETNWNFSLCLSSRADQALPIEDHGH